MYVVCLDVLGDNLAEYFAEDNDERLESDSWINGHLIMSQQRKKNHGAQGRYTDQKTSFGEINHSEC